MPPPKVHTTIEVWDRKKDLHKEAPKHNSVGVGLQKMLQNVKLVQKEVQTC
jgi:hypothetical protein